MLKNLKNFSNQLFFNLKVTDLSNHPRTIELLNQFLQLNRRFSIFQHLKRTQPYRPFCKLLTILGKQGQYNSGVTLGKLMNF